MIKETGEIMKKIGAIGEVINLAKAFAALTAEYTGNFETEGKKGKVAKRSTAPLILGKKFNIPPLILEGLLYSVKKDRKGVQKAILELC